MKPTKKQISSVRKELNLHTTVQPHIPALYLQQLKVGVNSTQHVRNEQANNFVIPVLISNNIIPCEGFTTEELQEAYCVCGLRPPKETTVNVEMNNQMYAKVEGKWYDKNEKAYAMAKFSWLFDKSKGKYIHCSFEGGAKEWVI